MRSVLNTITWGFLLLFFIPSAMIVASWNSLPGDRLYGTKLALERVLLAVVSPSYAAQGSLQVKYTERRFAESRRLLADKHSIVGLSYLASQVETTKQAVLNAPDAATRKDLAQTYLQTLYKVKTQLEDDKQAILTGQIVVTQSATNAGASPSPAPAKHVSKAIIPTATPTPVRPVWSLTSQQPSPTPRTLAAPTPTPSPTPRSESDFEQSTTIVPAATVTQITTTEPVEVQAVTAAMNVAQVQVTVDDAIREVTEVSGESSENDSEQGNSMMQGENNNRGNGNNQNQSGNSGNSMNNQGNNGNGQSDNRGENGGENGN